MNIEDNVLLDIILAPIQLTKNTLNYIKYDKNIKSVYRYVIFSNILSIIFSFIVNDYAKCFYYHIGSIIFVIYINYITNSSVHKEPYLKLYNNLKNIFNKKEKKEYEED